MLDRLNPEALFLEHLGWIEKVAALACRRHGVWDEEAEDFAGWVKLRLMEDDYAVFQKFRGESDLKTFLATTVVRYFHDYSRERRGRWRPSAAAEREGPHAVELEALVRRDGFTLQQAAEKMRTAGRTTLSDRELARLLESFPARSPLRPVEVASEVALEAARGSSRADGDLAAAEAGTRRGEVLDALGRALERMKLEDRMIVQLHFLERRTVAEVARALGLEQKPLYRRLERLLKELRKELEEEGVRLDDIRELVLDEEEEP